MKRILFVAMSIFIALVVFGCSNSLEDKSTDEIESFATPGSEFKVYGNFYSEKNSARPYFWWLDERLRNCFEENTKILTATGEKDVQDIAVGEYVISSDKKTLFYVYDTIHDDINDDIIVINANDKQLCVTGIHPIVTYKDGITTVVQAKSLSTGDFVFIGNEWVSIVIDKKAYKGTVYNLVLWDNNDELVSKADTYARTLYANGILTADLTVQDFLNK